MADKLWKQFERHVGKIIFNNSPRNMGSGKINRNDDGTPRAGDIVNETWCIECKCYKKIALFRWWDKLKKEAAIAGKIPVLVIKEVGNNKDILVTLHHSHFIELKEAWELAKKKIV